MSASGTPYPKYASASTMAAIVSSLAALRPLPTDTDGEGSSLVNDLAQRGDKRKAEVYLSNHEKRDSDAN